MSARKRVWVVGCVAAAAALVVGVLLLLPRIRSAVRAGPHHRLPLKRIAAPYATLPPPGPALAKEILTFDSDRTGNFEIFTMPASGAPVRRLTRDAHFDSWWPRPSPDRRHILFYRTPRGVHDRDPSRNSLWVMDADGSHVTQLRPAGTDGWQLQAHAEWSHDGARLVMTGGSARAPRIFVTTASGRDPRAVTHGGGLDIDPSWSPDDRTIYFVHCAGVACAAAHQEVAAVAADGAGPVRQLTHDRLADFDPYASPDGRRLAWLTQTSAAGRLGAWNIRVMTLPAGKPAPLTNDDDVNSKPAWSADGRTVYFHRLVKGGTRFELWSIPAGGGRPHELTAGQPGVNEYPGT